MESGLERTLVWITVFTIEAAHALDRGQHGSVKCEESAEKGVVLRTNSRETKSR